MNNKAQAEWGQITDRIRASAYTAFVNSNDPGDYNTGRLVRGGLERFKTVKESKGLSLYFRYAPQQDRDELPIDLIAHVLLLGRFLYEHLFPVPPDADRLPRSEIPPMKLSNQGYSH